MARSSHDHGTIGGGSRQWQAPRRRPLTALLVGLALALVLLSGCGGGEEISIETAQAGSALGASLLTPGQSGEEQMAALSFEGSITVLEAAGEQPGDGPALLRLQLAGAYDLERPASSLTTELVLGGGGGQAAAGQSGLRPWAQLGPMELRRVDGSLYGRGGPLALLGATDRWLAVPAGDERGETNGLDSLHALASPSALLDHLETSTALEVEDLGREEVRGVDTRHVRVSIDTAGLRHALGQAAEEAAGSGAGDGSTGGDAWLVSTPVDLWLDDSGVVHRITLAVDGPAPVLDMIGAQSFVELELELFDHGQAPEITAPVAAEVVGGDRPELDLEPGG